MTAYWTQRVRHGSLRGTIRRRRAHTASYSEAEGRVFYRRLLAGITSAPS